MSKSAKVLTCTTYPYLKVYVPELQEHRRFEAGKLVISPDDPAYDFMVAKAAADPHIAIRDQNDDGSTGAQLKGAAAKGLICDACQPPQTFASEEARAEHVATLHTNADETEAPAPRRQPVVQQGTVRTTSAPARRRAPARGRKK